MTHKIFSLLLFSLVLASCSSTWKEPLVIELDQSELPECITTACPEVSVSYISYEGKAKKVQAINDSISHFIIGALNLGDPDASAIAQNPHDAIQFFIKDYWRDTSEFPDINEYEAEVLVVENFRSENLISISMSQYSYIGGAHGYSNISYKNVAVKTGEVLTNNDLIKDTKGLSELAEKKLREKYNLPELDGLNTTIFWFENDEFYLSNAIGLENGNLVIHYNQYEIASYVDGPINIEIPFTEVASFLNYSLEK
jgi:hypothetical protein